ncbi:hypothetical protein [Arcicella rosea]|uniref:DUF7668 domain-containing protein n=1 Tax=Arcicella rosea TaxID=502909 RepID=A0A841F0Y7_9BACT|nr:hypothetical protein [Arcicella rosea]MBB6005451.1 hypothetical protein [Arcicella rosea]
MEKNKIEITVKYLLKLIINHQFDLIFENNLYKKISKEDFEEEVLTHPGKLTMPPIYQLNNLDFYETNFDNQVWVDVPLWFDHKESDLTLSCLIYNVNEEEYKYSIEDIHVL